MSFGPSVAETGLAKWPATAVCVWQLVGWY